MAFKLPRSKGKQLDDKRPRCETLRDCAVQYIAVALEGSEAMLRGQSSCSLSWLTTHVHPCNTNGGCALGAIIMDEKMKTKAMKREAAVYPNW